MRVPQHRIKYYVLGFYILILSAWQALFSAQIIPDFLFPSPLQVARRLGAGKRVVTMVPDSAERYVSKKIFEGGI